MLIILLKINTYIYKRKNIALSIIFILLFSTSLTACGSIKKKAALPSLMADSTFEQDQKPVVIEVEKQSIDKIIRIRGDIVSKNIAKVFFKNSGGY